TITTNVAHGTLTDNGATLHAGDTFTQADIDGGKIVYTHDGGETTADSFKFTLDDGHLQAASASTATQGVFAITVTPVNDAPTLATDTGTTLNEGASHTITSSELAVSDPDNIAAERTYTLVSTVMNGTLSDNGVSLGAGDTFTQADIDSGKIVY